MPMLSARPTVSRRRSSMTRSSAPSMAITAPDAASPWRRTGCGPRSCSAGAGDQQHGGAAAVEDDGPHAFAVQRDVVAGDDDRLVGEMQAGLRADAATRVMARRRWPTGCSRRADDEGTASLLVAADDRRLGPTGRWACRRPGWPRAANIGGGCRGARAAVRISTEASAVRAANAVIPNSESPAAGTDEKLAWTPSSRSIGPAPVVLIRPSASSGFSGACSSQRCRRVLRATRSAAVGPKARPVVEARRDPAPRPGPPGRCRRCGPSGPASPIQFAVVVGEGDGQSLMRKRRVWSRPMRLTVIRLWPPPTAMAVTRGDDRAVVARPVEHGGSQRARRPAPRPDRVGSRCRGSRRWAAGCRRIVGGGRGDGGVVSRPALGGKRCRGRRRRPQAHRAVRASLDLPDLLDARGGVDTAQGDVQQTRSPRPR